MAKLLFVLAALALPVAVAAAEDGAWEPSDWESAEPDLQRWSDPPVDDDMATLELGSAALAHPRGGKAPAAPAGAQDAVGRPQAAGTKGVVDVKLNSELQQDKGKDLLGDGRLLKEVQTAGEGRCPEPGEWVKIHYACRLAGSEEVIDSSYARGQPFMFTLAEGDVIPGWESGIASMRCGERARLTMHPDLAYGAAGCGGGAVPAAEAAPASGAEGASASGMPQGALSYEVELLEMGRSLAGDGEDLSPEECLQRAMRAKDTGNAHFKSGDLKQAAEVYVGALQLLGHSDEMQENDHFQKENDVRWSDSARREARDKLLLACCLNLAQCELRLERFIEAFKHASVALGLDPSSSKAYYRRGLAALGSGLLDQAKADIVKAARLEPKNAEIRGQLQVCQQRLQDSEQKDRSTFGGMFQRGPLSREKEAAEGAAAPAPETETEQGGGGASG